MPWNPVRVTLEQMNVSPQTPDQRPDEDRQGTVKLPKPFPLVRYYLLASILLVVGASAILNFSTQRIQSGTAINSLRQEAEADVERVVFDISVAITSYFHPGDNLATALQANQREFDRDVINALSGFPIPRVDLLTPGSNTTLCEWKGRARYWSLRVGVHGAEDAAWSYPDPDPAYAVIRDALAFHAGRVDACYVAGQRVTPQPGEYYGGWITSDIVGPFKGIPGSERW